MSAYTCRRIPPDPADRGDAGGPDRPEAPPEPPEEYASGSLDERRDEVTRLLRGGLDGEGERADLLALVYDELRDIARNRMARERPEHTLQATALVHEAYMRLVCDAPTDWQSRKHFYGAAAEAMRRVLVDHARRVRSQKRGGERLRVTLGGDFAAEWDADRLIALDDALDKLAAEDARAAEVTRLRFFSGLSVEETARAMEVSERTVHREWTYARARLTELLGAGEE